MVFSDCPVCLRFIGEDPHLDAWSRYGELRGDARFADSSLL